LVLLAIEHTTGQSLDGCALIAFGLVIADEPKIHERTSARRSGQLTPHSGTARQHWQEIPKVSISKL
jgi:hypothetical protein